MHIEGSYVLKSPRARVWEFISDPTKFAPCLPDLQSIEIKDSRTFTVTVGIGVSFVRGTFKFDFTLLEQHAPSHSRFQGIGKGAGVSVQLTAEMDLTEVDADSTGLKWKADAVLGGLLGELSPSLIQGSTGKFTEQFFQCIRTKLESQS